MSKLLFQKFVDRDEKEVGHRTSKKSGHWVREKYLNKFYNLQYFTREEKIIVAVYKELPICNK